MKYFIKVFFYLVFVILIIFGSISLFIMKLTYTTVLNQEKDIAISQDKKNMILIESQIGKNEFKNDYKKLGNFIKIVSNDINFQLYDLDNKMISSNIELNEDINKFASQNFDVEKEIVVSDVLSYKNKSIILIKEKIEDENLILVTLHYLTNYDSIVDQMSSYYRYLLLILVLITLPLAYLLARMITKPVNQLIDVTKDISKGNVSSRADISTGDEITELSKSLNKMADKLFSDIENIKSAKEQQELFLANFAHEIRTPLTSIMGYVQILEWSDLNEEDAESIAYILKESTRLKNLSLDILKLIRLNQSELEVTNINTTEITEMLEQFLRGYNKSISYSINLEDAQIALDFNLITLLSINILSNSIESFTEFGKIEINGVKENDYYVLTFEDNGPGIEESKVKNVMEEFYTGNENRDNHHLGLGLSIVKKVAELHKGKVVIRSELDKGTIITVYLKIGECLNEE